MRQPAPPGSTAVAFINLRAATEILERDHNMLLEKARAVVKVYTGKDKPGWSPMDLRKAIMELDAVVREDA